MRNYKSAKTTRRQQPGKNFDYIFMKYLVVSFKHSIEISYDAELY